MKNKKTYIIKMARNFVKKMMERKIAEYKILLTQGLSEEDMNREIVAHLSEGWEIYGQHQLAINWDKHNDTDCITLTQAVVKYK